MRNEIVIDGILTARDTIRYTPGGVAALNMSLQHQSEQIENGRAVQVNVEMNVVAYGETAQAMLQLSPGSKIVVKGFLNRKNQFSRVTQLHATQFKIL